MGRSFFFVEDRAAGAAHAFSLELLGGFSARPACARRRSRSVPGITDDPEYFQFFSSFFAKYYAYYKILQCRASSLEAQFAGPNAQGGVRQPLDARESAAHSALAPRNLPGVTTS